jgi:hypothetical protein
MFTADELKSANLTESLGLLEDAHREYQAMIKEIDGTPKAAKEAARQATLCDALATLVGYLILTRGDMR